MAGALLDGVLPWAYSQGNRLRNRLTELVSDPVGTVQQAAGQLGDSANAMHGLLTQAYADPKSFQPTNQNALAALVQGLQAGPLGFAPVGMTAWHGSPHVFDQFDSSKIGTGEGAQAYGHGLYLAEAPAVAEGYASRLSSDRAGNVYKVDLPDNAVARMLDWDKPLSQQPAAVQKVAKKLGIRPEGWAGNTYVMGSGEQGYVTPEAGQFRAYVHGPGDQGLFPSLEEARAAVVRQVGGPRPINTGAQLYERIGPEEVASEKLRKLGIPGIRYLDAGSRGTGQGSSNFVVFPGEESALQVLERNGQPLK